MATFSVTGVGPGRPVLAMTSQPEGGPDAAVASAGALLPGRALDYVATGTWLAPPATEDGDLLLATYGDTVVLLGTEPEDLDPAPEAGTWGFVLQTTAMAYVVSVDAPPLRRWIGIAPGEVIPDEGEPLEFERPFLTEGQYVFPDEEPGFDLEGWGRAAMLWVFGYDPADAYGDGPPGPFDAATAPLHAVRVRAPEIQTTAVAQQRQGRPWLSWLRRG